MTRAWLVAGLGVCAVACSDSTTTLLSPLNLDRPVDVAFACYGTMRDTDLDTSTVPPHRIASAAQPILVTAQPRAACEKLSPQVTPTTTVLPVAGQETIDSVTPKPAWYAFILQSAAGTVAVATWPTKAADKMTSGSSDVNGEFKVLDTDPLTPGKNAISVGEDPVAIATDRAGCFEVTANAGSCDLSALDVTSALNAATGETEGPVRVDRLPVKNGMNQLILARPAAMVAEPGLDESAVGDACPATPTGKVYVAYPSCHLVAGVDLSTGVITSGIRFDAAGVPTILGAAELAGITCPVECSIHKLPPDVTSIASAPPSAGTRPVALDHQLDTRHLDPPPATPGPDDKVTPTSRLAIGADNLGKITVVDLSIPDFLPTSALQVPLEAPAGGGSLGVTAVAISPQIGMGGDATTLGQDVELTDVDTVGGQAQFVYAVATDGTVRVADVLQRKYECDTQIDGRYLQTFMDPKNDPRKLACMRINDPDPALNLPRRSGARGPGIELPRPAVPTSVAIIKGRNKVPIITNSDMTTKLQSADPSLLIGYFAVITSTTGAAFVVNIDDDYAPDVFDKTKPVETAPVLIMAHQLRDGFINRGAPPQTTPSVLQPDGTTKTETKPSCLASDPLTVDGGGLAGGPRAGAPTQGSPTGTIDAARNKELPRLRSVRCQTPEHGDADKAPVSLSEVQFGANPLEVRNPVFPDLKSVQTESWQLTYEGALSLDNSTTAIDGPQIRHGTARVDSFGMRLADPAKPFCDMGVEPGDIVDLRGCNPSNLDADCPANYTCFVHPVSTLTYGACLLKTEASRLANTCKDFLTTQRHYTVGVAPASDPVKAGELVLFERIHELSMTPVDGCTSDQQCVSLSELAARINPAADPVGHTWKCQTDPLRPRISPDDATNKRCVQTCFTTANCVAGTVCRNPGMDGQGNPLEGVCMEGVEPPQACINGPQRFTVRASEAFAVVGERSGYVHPIITGPNDVCVRNEALGASTVQQGRIPLKAPKCDPITDPPTNPLTGRRPDGTFEPNPCMLDEVENFEAVSTYTYPPAGGCAKASDSDTLMSRLLPAIRFRNRAMTITLVDPTYPGDSADACIQDRMGALGHIPFVVPGYQLNFAQRAGFSPSGLPLVSTVSPVRVVRGPTDSIWVIDDGDFLTTGFNDSPTRGKVYRVESTDTGVFNIMQ